MLLNVHSFYALATAIKMMQSKRPKQFRYFLQVWMASLLAIGLNYVWIPTAHAQLPNLSDLSNRANQQPNISYVQRGNLHIADVTLDGIPLLQVAAAAENSAIADDSRTIFPIEWRVNEIETRLENVAHSEFDPETLSVQHAITDDGQQAVIRAVGEDWEQHLMTVTEFDRQIDSTFSSLSDIAEVRAAILEDAIIKANRERQPAYVQQQLRSLLFISSGVIISSLVLLQLQKRLRRRWRQLNLEATEETTSEPPAPHTATVSEKDGMKPATAADTEESGSPHLLFTQQRNFNLAMQSLVWWAQIGVWWGGLAVGLRLFPQTREAGLWLSNVPVSFFAILLGITVAKEIIDIFITYCLRKWAEYSELEAKANSRAALRVPVISRVAQEVVLYVAISAGVMLFLNVVQAPLTIVLTIVGVVGFSAQNLIKDWIEGFLILWEDQYTLGDVVKIGTTVGVVEYLNLRITQLRTLDGELATIANSSFTTAINLTHQWSRINLGIDVAYTTDLDRAMTIIEDVAAKMLHDPAWGALITEPATILGVDAFGENGITIRLLITTQPMKQWDVGREYRRRLKQAFDLAGITIPLPQRSIWFENLPTGTSTQGSVANPKGFGAKNDC